MSRLPPVSNKRAAELASGARRNAPNSTFAARTDPMPRGDAELERRTPIRKRNPERLARLHARQFGDDGYYEHIKATPCIVTGAVNGESELPVEAAHVVRKRSVGGGPESMAPLRVDVHRDFDDELLSDERFELAWKVSRADIRVWAILHRSEWDAGNLADATGVP